MSLFCQTRIEKLQGCFRIKDKIRLFPRRLTSFCRILPDFIIIGAHKCGTTALYDYLVQHPNIASASDKEIHFFDRSPHYPSPNSLATSSPLYRVLGSEPWERRQILAGCIKIAKRTLKGRLNDALWWGKWTFGFYNEDWYSGLFSQAGSDRACGEITPAYSMLEDHDVARINAINPDTKLIFMIRNPIERAWSAIRYDVYRESIGISIDSDEEIIAELRKRHFRLRGDYERTLECYLKFFNSSQILVCFYDAIQRDPVRLMAGITSFLNVGPFLERDIDSERRINTSPSRKMPLTTAGQ